MLQLKCNQLDQLKCNHCLPLLNQSKDTWFQAMAMKRTNWSWGFLMHSLRAGSECLSLVGRHLLPGLTCRHPSFQGPGESQGALTQGSSHTSGPDEDLWTLQGFSSNLCFLAILCQASPSTRASSLPPSLHCLISISHLFPDPHWRAECFGIIVMVPALLLWVCAFISPLSFRPSLPSPDGMNEEFLCIC